MRENKNIFDTPLDYLIGDRFGRYAKYIIQERALPDVRDGLKPVQRRIIYAMLVNGNIPSKQYRKSATACGFVIGHYHPHGDTAVYEAMVRMSQWWKQNAPLIDMQGNNGSLDDDPPAAMRYTEARLSVKAMELLRDIDKDTVTFAPNYDDTTEEPTVLPSRFPNLLVNGSEGIAAGYSTSIPPHNLNEVCKATIYRIKHPRCSLDDILNIVPGPDFPTGGIIRGKEGIKEALGTGSGQVQVACKSHIEERKHCNALVIEEIPFGVVKKQLVASIDKIRLDKEVDGIIEVRDETDRTGLQIVVEIKKDIDVNYVVNYLMKKTKLVVNYTYNSIVICDKKPIRVGILDILDYYIKHQIEVVNRRTLFDLNKTKARHHIVEGLAKAISNIDELIKIVRTSSSKEEIKNRLVERFKIDLEQAEAIVTIQLHRLNSVDVKDLMQECEDLKKKEEELSAIYNNEDEIKKIIISELQDIITRFPTPRLSIIEDKVEEYVQMEKPIVKENCYIALTRDGYYKRSSVRSYESSEGALPSLKAGDILINYGLVQTTDTIIGFTNAGNFIYLPVHELVESKWKEEGRHISSVINVSGIEKFVNYFIVRDFLDSAYFVIVTANNIIKRVKISDFILERYSKASSAIKFNDDKIVEVGLSDGDSMIVLISRKGKIVKYHESQVSIMGTRASGVRAMKLEEDDNIGSMVVINNGTKGNILTLSSKGNFKITSPSVLSLINRPNKPQELFKFYRSEPDYAIKSILTCKPYTYQGLYKESIRDYEYEDKPSALSKQLKPFDSLPNRDEFKTFIYNTYKIIDKNYKTYLDAVAPEVNKVEESNERTTTVFDLLDEIKDD